MRKNPVDCKTVDEHETRLGEKPNGLPGIAKLQFLNENFHTFSARYRQRDRDTAPDLYTSMGHLLAGEEQRIRNEDVRMKQTKKDIW